MNITSNEVIDKLNGKLNDGISTLMTTKNHLTSFQKDLEATVTLQLKGAKVSLRGKMKDAKEAMAQAKQLMEAKKEETVEAVAEWKVKRHQQKLAKRAERAEAYADACVMLTLYYAAEAELAVLEAITARQDATIKQKRRCKKVSGK